MQCCVARTATAPRRCDPELLRNIPVLRQSSKWVESSPVPAFLAEEHVCRLGTCAAGGIVGELRSRKLRPCLLNGSNQLPFRFDFITTSKESRVTSHSVEQQRFIGYWSLGSECLAIAEVELHVGRVHLRSWALGGEIDGDAFIGLNAKSHDVAMNFPVRLVREQGLRCPLEMHCNFRKVAR